MTPARKAARENGHRRRRGHSQRPARVRVSRLQADTLAAVHRWRCTALVIGLFFLSSVRLFFVEIVREYIGSIYTQVRNHPHVFQKERINFGDD
jgi:hypothetical protein